MSESLAALLVRFLVSFLATFLPIVIVVLVWHLSRRWLFPEEPEEPYVDHWLEQPEAHVPPPAYYEYKHRLWTPDSYFWPGGLTVGPIPGDPKAQALFWGENEACPHCAAKKG